MILIVLRERTFDCPCKKRHAEKFASVLEDIREVTYVLYWVQGWGRLQKPDYDYDYDYSAHKIIDYDYDYDYDYNHPITITVTCLPWKRF